MIGGIDPSTGEIPVPHSAKKDSYALKRSEKRRPGVGVDTNWASEVMGGTFRTLRPLPM
jgi:hypothetical protein